MDAYLVQLTMPDQDQPQEMESAREIIQQLKKSLEEKDKEIKMLLQKIDSLTDKMEKLIVQINGVNPQTAPAMQSIAENTQSKKQDPEIKPQKCRKRKNKSKTTNPIKKAPTNMYEILAIEDTTNQQETSSSDAESCVNNEIEMQDEAETPEQSDDENVENPSNHENQTPQALATEIQLLQQAISKKTKNNQPNQEERTTNEKVPPIVLRDKSKWTATSKYLSNQNIIYTKAQTYVDGIRIHPQTSNDYRKIIRFFDSQKLEYHTYQLPSEKLLHVIIKGIPEQIDVEDVKNDLMDQGFNPVTISRLRSFKTKQPLPIIITTLQKTEKEIFQVKSVLNLMVTVETQRQKPGFSQCHRCQRFGHSQMKCTANPKCVKCAGNHHTLECTKDKTTPATCANCGGQHTASYRGCNQWPKLRGTEHHATKPGTSYADTLKTNKNSNKEQEMTMANLFQNFHKMYTEMQKIAMQMSSMFANKST